MKKLNLDEQIKLYSIPTRIIYAQKTPERGGWKLLSSKAKGVSVETLVWKDFISNGWSGVNDEGQTIIAITQALSYAYQALTNQPFIGYFEKKHDYYLNHSEHKLNVANFIEKIEYEQFKKILKKNFALLKKISRRPKALTENNCLELWRLFGAKFFALWVELHMKTLRNYPSPLGHAGIANGIPDLLIWKTHLSGKIDIEFVEVKASGDRLQDSQIDWMRNVASSLKLKFSLVLVCEGK